jgi:uncharacterized membrane protein YwzB
MNLIGLVVTILVAAVLLWALDQFPLDATLKRLIKVVVIVVVAILCILFLAAMFGYRGSIHLP